MISLGEAQRRIGQLPRGTPRVERVALEQAPGRVLATAPASDLDLPPFDRVTMDGYAVRAADAREGTRLRSVGRLTAGSVAAQPLGPGEALRIMTGAPLPPGADAVVPIEDCRADGGAGGGADGGTVLIGRTARSGQNVHPRATDLRRGMTPLGVGTRITAATIPLLATLGCRQVAVFRAPIVGILTTGDELVEPDVVPTGGQIRDSNRFALAAQVRSAACEPAIQPLVRDDPAAIRAAVARSLEACDVTLMTGGSSVGDLDYSRVVLEGLGARCWFDQVSIKPGKPVVLFTLGERAIFCLPGNPVSAFVTFEVLARPFLELVAGAQAPWPVAHAVPLTRPLAAPRERDLLQVARLVTVGQPAELAAEPIRWSGSGDLVAIADAAALVHLKQGQSLDAGARAPVLLLRNAWDRLPRAAAPDLPPAVDGPS